MDNEEAINIVKPSQNKKKRSWLSIAILVLLAVIITIPLFILIYRYVPDIKVPVGDGYRIDHYLTAFLLFSFIFLLIRIFRHIVLGIIIAVLIVLTSNDIRGDGNYGFSDIIKDYKALLYYIEIQPIKIPFLKEFKMTIKNAAQIEDAIDYQNPDVRNFAVSNSTRYFNNAKLYYRYNDVVRYFSLFKSVNENWVYVHDPKDQDYYACASETLQHLAGDCDDYAIFMATCIKAIGGEARLIRTPNHMYPEVKICKEKNFERIHYLIKERLFQKESKYKKIHYHLDDGYVWLNFDYTASYPGGKFISLEITGMLNI